MPAFRFAVPGLCVACAFLAAAPAARAELVFELNGLNGTDQNSVNARAGFRRAADLWSELFTDDVTVRLDVDFRNLGSGILGQAGSQFEEYSLGQVQGALAGDATGTRDATAAASALALGTAIDFRTDLGASRALGIDNNNTRNNQFVRVNRANARALGLLAGDAAGSDASITFNSSFGFDFDRSDGIGSGLFDFVGVAAHEIGHALGFVSGNGIIDATTQNLDGFAILSTLDLFRYSDASLAAAGSDGIDVSTVTGDGNLPYLSIDGGLTRFENSLFETGSSNGSGRQGSHWRDNLGLGIMDPTAARGELVDITGLDVAAFDVIGYDLRVAAVPEPGTWALDRLRRLPASPPAAAGGAPRFDARACDGTGGDHERSKHVAGTADALGRRRSRSGLLTGWTVVGGIPTTTGTPAPPRPGLPMSATLLLPLALIAPSDRFKNHDVDNSRTAPCTNCGNYFQGKCDWIGAGVGSSGERYPDGRLECERRSSGAGRPAATDDDLRLRFRHARKSPRRCRNGRVAS